MQGAAASFRIMPTTISSLPSSAALSDSIDSRRGVLTTHALLRTLFTAVPIIAGADKFTHLLAQWDVYLNPLVLRVIPVSAMTFMYLVGVIEIAAGVLVWLKPRIGAYVVMAWLIAIALQLLLWGQFLDIAVRDLVIAVSGPWVLARLTPLVAAERGRADQA